MDKATDIILHRIFSPRASYGKHLQNIKPPYFLKSIESLIQNRYYTITYQIFDDRIEILKKRNPLKTKIYIIDLTIFDVPSLQKISHEINLQIDPPIVFIVGQAATAIPENCLNFFDKDISVYVIGGEPEGVLEDVVFSSWPKINFEKLNEKTFHKKNRILARNQYSHFTESPPIIFSRNEIQSYQYFFPIRHNEAIVWGHIIATRGCPHSCSFCTHLIRESYGTRMRKKNIMTVLEEIKQQQRLGVNMIAFGDDDLTGDQVYLQDLCRALIEQKFNIKWTAHARIDECSVELLQLMKLSGCSLLRFGLESGSPKVLISFQKTRSPERWWSQIQLILSSCKTLDIQTCGLFILGSPEDEFSTLFQTFMQIIKSPLDLIQLHFFTPYEDTIEAKKLATKAKLTQQDHYAWNFVNYSKASRFQIRLFYILIYFCFYLNPFRLASFFKNYFRFMLTNKNLALTLVQGYVRVIFQFIPFRQNTRVHVD